MIIFKNIFRNLKLMSFACLLGLTSMSFVVVSGEPPQVTVKLPAGTSVNLETTRQISTETLQAGQTVDFKVSSDVIVDKQVVIPAGSIAKGLVTRADKPKAIGKEGRIEIQIKSVKSVDGQDIPLAGGSLYKEGEDKQTLAIVLGVLLCILCLFIKGKDAVVPIGTSVSSNVAANTEVEVK